MNMKRKLKMPHAYVIIVIMLIITSIMTYFIPAGEYARYVNEAGTTIVDGASFHFVEANPVPLWWIPIAIEKALSHQSSVIFSIMLIAGGIEVVLATRMFHVFCYKMASICKGKEKWFIPLLMTFFSLLGITQAPNKFIGFAPVGVMLAYTLGYDALVGISITLLGVATGFVCGILGPTTALAQQLAELPAYSGMSLRIVAHIGMLAVTSIYVMKYAERTKKDPTQSILYNVPGVMQFEVEESDSKIETRHWMVFIVFIASLTAMMYGCIKFSWGFDMCSVCFLWMGVIGGLVYGFSPDRICNEFIKGLKGSVSAGILIGFGAAVAVILNKASVLDTVVMSLASALNYVPGIFRGPVLLFANTIINFFVLSGSGQAAVVMPVMTPVADLANVSRQTAVLAYKLGDGFTNYLYPHSSSLMGFIGAVGITYDKWAKFFGKLFVIWTVGGCILLMFAHVIHYV